MSKLSIMTSFMMLMAICLLFQQHVFVSAFTTTQRQVPAAATTTTTTTKTSLNAISRRSLLLETTTTTVAVTGIALLGFDNRPAFADDNAVDDLAMPSVEEQAAADKAAMEAKLKKKAELQKSQGKPMGFRESMAAEKNKQESLKRSKEQRRIDLCEELGRGC